MTKVTKERCKKRYKQRLPANAAQRTKATKKTAYVCTGGPWDGETLYLSSPNTLPIECSGFKGKYIESEVKGSLVWHNLQKYNVGDIVEALSDVKLEASCDHPKLHCCSAGMEYKIKEVDEYGCVNVGTQAWPHTNHFKLVRRA